MNGDKSQIITLKFFLIVSVVVAEDVVEVHVLVEYLALDYYISALVLLITLLEIFQVHGYSWIPVWPQVYEITNT